MILSCGFMSDAVEGVLGDIHAGIRLRYVHEEEPLGTAGPLRLALDSGALQDERLFVLNGDVLTDMDLTAEREQHERTGARATLCLIAVDDTASYGVVPTTPTTARSRSSSRSRPGRRRRTGSTPARTCSSAT